AHINAKFFDLAEKGHEALLNMMDLVAAGLDIKPDKELENVLITAVSAMTDEIDKSEEQQPETSVESKQDESSNLRPMAQETSNVDEPSDEEVDAEILEIFNEEAGDLIEGIEEAVQGWEEDKSSKIYLEDMKRLLHTL